MNENNIILIRKHRFFSQRKMLMIRISYLIVEWTLVKKRKINVLFTRIRAFLQVHFAYSYLCGRGLRPLLRTVAKRGSFTAGFVQMKGRFDSCNIMQFKNTPGFVWKSGLSERCIMVLAAQSGFFQAIVKAFDTPNDILIYLHKSILLPFQLSFVAARILSFLS